MSWRHRFYSFVKAVPGLGISDSTSSQAPLPDGINLWRYLRLLVISNRSPRTANAGIFSCKPWGSKLYYEDANQVWYLSIFITKQSKILTFLSIIAQSIFLPYNNCLQNIVCNKPEMKRKYGLALSYSFRDEAW